jgi:hypothetical protein
MPLADITDDSHTATGGEARNTRTVIYAVDARTGRRALTHPDAV